MNKKALILGGVSPHIELIEILKSNGYETILADYLDNPPAKKYADLYYQISTLDKEAILNLAKELKVDIVLTVCVDHANVTMCYVAEKLGLPHPYDHEVALNTTDKTKMKRIMMENGIPTSKFMVVGSADQIDSCEGLNFPVVIKPADNNGSKGVIRCNSLEEVKKNISTTLELSRSGKAVIEEYVDGIEIQVDCFVNYGKANVLMIKKKLPIINDQGLAFQVHGSVTLNDMDASLSEEIRTVADKISKAFGIEHTPFFFQAKVLNGRLSVIELTPRIGGGLGYKILKRYVGQSIINLAFQSYFGNISNLTITPKKNIILSNIIYAKNGRLSEINGIEKLISEGVIESFDMMSEFGRELGNYMDSRNRVGGYIIEADNMDDMLRKSEYAFNTIDVLDENGNSIKVQNLYYKN